jgi:hypothetical protein
MEFKQFLDDKKDRKYEYSSLMFNLPEYLADNIISWGFDHIPDDFLFYDPKDMSFGREMHTHITLMYGLNTAKVKYISKLFLKEKSFSCKLGEIDLFTKNERFDVLIINVNCDNLHKLNQKICRELDVTITHPIYIPHVTICYLKKNKGNKYVGNKDFNNEKFELNELIFSSKNGTKTPIKLGEK